jgi:hypothetical protein
MIDKLPVHLGASPYHAPNGAVGWEQVELGGQVYLKVSNVDAMPPFFMSIVSDSDPWLFVGSQGAFIAGRVQPDSALFPYLNVDQILSRPDYSGARTAMLVRRSGSWALWEPWQTSGRAYDLRRNLYKHVHGTSVLFEETNVDLQLRFRWELSTCEEFGLVRSCVLENLSSEPVDIRYLDGWHQMIPPGLSSGTVASLSYLVSAYMRHDKVPGLPLGIYTLNSLIVDRAEPAESLRAAVGWSLGHANPTLLLSDRQLDSFRRGKAVRADLEVRGAPGACLIADEVVLEPRQGKEWIHVADTELDHSALVTLQDELTRPDELGRKVKAALVTNRENLRGRIAAGDGLQQSADEQASMHHYANVLYNSMRGGTFPEGYSFPRKDFEAFLQTRNAAVFARSLGWLEALPDPLSLEEMRTGLAGTNDLQLRRLASEYLPLTFSRRHGDPSRPWNRFAIKLRDEKGRPIYGYEGNWRDIFQNWEGLAASYPSWLPNMINVFLNATTADGYNPYRITREGIDWEVPDPHDPWSQIGYWGDHQIIYLLRLLEADERYHPGRLATELSRQAYAYAEIPYEIGGFEALMADPRNSISFNHELNQELVNRAEALGGDGRLLPTLDGDVALVTLAEKLLVPLLAKLTNYVPGGGIWLNTQRPEWNDANNALAGWGLSMVTVYYIRRYLTFCQALFGAAGLDQVALSGSLASLLDEVTAALGAHGNDAYETVERLGRAGEAYRAGVYKRRMVPVETVSMDRIDSLLSTALTAVDASIRANKRPDGLYHGYNTLEMKPGQAKVEYLCEMLEGQVAVLSAGLLSDREVLDLLAALRQSELYREDQHSYLLYPDRELPPFLEKNALPAGAAERVGLLQRLLEDEDHSLVIRDAKGRVHFQGDLRNAGDVEDRLERLRAGQANREAVLGLWEEVFNHRAFTGRSSTFFAFEGLGSIYWHMVAKLLLAVQECHDTASEEYAGPLAEAYDDLRRGLGFTKTPEVFGGIPTDPYSHSPRHLGAQQPGMTGQVKEEILTRLGELGLEARNGCLHFEPRLLHRAEFVTGSAEFDYVDVMGREKTLRIPANGLVFTACQVPVCYRLADTAAVTLRNANGSEDTVQGAKLSKADSTRVFSRDGSIWSIMVDVPRDSLRA